MKRGERLGRRWRSRAVEAIMELASSRGGMLVHDGTGLFNAP